MSMIKRSAFGAVALVSAGLLLTACGEAPEETPAPAASEGTETGDAAPASDFQPCLVSDEGGWNDRSFNQSAKEGMDRAAEELGVTATDMQSNDPNDYAPNLDQLVSQGCDLIVSVGFNLSADTVASALENPDINYAIVDDLADNDFNGETDAPNIRPLVFDTAGAAYLGGYAAASWSHASGVDKVGTFGGAKIPSVTIFMDGFQQGVEKFNEDNDASVGLVGWDMESQEGLFTDSFEANDKARQTAEQVLSQGADVILPVGGPIYTSAIAAIRDSYPDAVMLGVDSDLALKEPDNADVVLASIMKGIDEATYQAAIQASESGADFDTTPYVGTIENGGVGLSEFHDFESELPEGLTDELAALQEQLVSGDIVVDSPAAP